MLNRFPYRHIFRGVWLAVCVAALGVGSVQFVSAQTLGELEAAQGGMDALNQGPVGSGAGNVALDRARELQGAQPPVADQGFGPVDQAVQGVTERIVPTIRVISGERVFDPISGILLDEPREMAVPNSERENYYDDGTHGDLLAGDGQFTRVVVREDVISGGNQRVKERLITALRAANEMTPLEFTGADVMSTERHENVSRNRAWKLTPDPDGLGMILDERPIDDPQFVPKYRDKQREKDARIRNDWSFRFLQEYRTNKDNLTSEFYRLHIPVPPMPPSTRPPNPNLWIPFSDPGSLERNIQQRAANPQAGRGAFPGSNQAINLETGAGLQGAYFGDGGMD